MDGWALRLDRLEHLREGDMQAFLFIGGGLIASRQVPQPHAPGVHRAIGAGRGRRRAAASSRPEGFPRRDHKGLRNNSAQICRRVAWRESGDLFN